MRPRLIASISTSTSVNAVTMMPTASGRTSRAAFSRSRPVILGIRWSVTIAATSSDRASARASSPLLASSSLKLRPKLNRNASRLSDSSSTTSTGYFARSSPCCAMTTTVAQARVPFASGLL